MSVDQRLASNDIAELIPEFTVMLQATNRSPRTVQTYLRGVRGLEAFLRERGMPTAVDAVAREHVEAYFAYLLDRGYKPASAKAWYDGIRRFFGWCEEEGEVADGRNPMRHVRPPKVVANPPDVLHEDQIKALLNACDGRTFEDRRDAALVMVMYDTGVRLAECSGLTLHDVDIADRREVRVLGKGRKERTVPIGANGARALGRYLRMRRQHRDAPLPNLWLGIRGPMTDPAYDRPWSGGGSRPGSARFFEEIPKSATGKILRRVLIERDRAQTATPTP